MYHLLTHSSFLLALHIFHTLESCYWTLNICNFYTSRIFMFHCHSSFLFPIHFFIVPNHLPLSHNTNYTFSYHSFISCSYNFIKHHVGFLEHHVYQTSCILLGITQNIEYTFRYHSFTSYIAWVTSTSWISALSHTHIDIQVIRPFFISALLSAWLHKKYM